jgi:tetratricopeptide (TPR) repeat protein
MSLRMDTNDAATGMRLARMGRFADALPYLERAQRAAPEDLPLLHAVASAMQLAGRRADAVALYHRTADRLPENAEVLTGWARASLLMGGVQQAVTLLDHALAADVRLAAPGGMLENLLAEIADPDMSCTLLEPLADRYPERVDLLLRYAHALTLAERLDEAEKAYERLSVLQPLDPVPLVELARLAINRGEPERAMASLQAALKIAPDHPAALWEQSQLGNGLLDAAELDHLHALVRAERDPWRLAPLHDVLARHHDRAGEYAQAATHIVQANAMQAAFVQPRAAYVPALMERDTGATIGDFTPAVFQRLRDAGCEDDRPVFIVGMPRSGTTLLQQMLTSHPSIVSVGEQAFAQRGYQRAAGGVPMERMPESVVRDAASWHLDSLLDRMRRLALAPDAKRIIDKLPDNYQLAGWLAIAFPNATIIHCLRDPRDVALSCWRTQFSNLAWSFDLDHIVHRIEQHRRLMRHWRATIGDRLTEIRYEHLVAKPEDVLRKLLSAMRLDWHPDVLAFTQTRGFVRSASQYQVRERLNPRGVGHWRRYEDALRPFLPRLNAIVAQDALELPPSGDSP